MQPRSITRALDRVVATLQNTQGAASHLAHLKDQVKALDRELANLAETAARGGAVPAVLDALAQRDAERRRLLADVTALTRSVGQSVPPATMRARLNGFLKDWDDLLTAHGPEARGVLDTVLADRIQFTPDATQRRHHLSVPIAFDRVLSCVLPELAGDVTRNAGVPNG